MNDDPSQPQRVPVEFDMDKAREQLAELSDEFQTLLTQSFRIAIKRAVEEQGQSGGPQGGSLTSDATLNSLAATATQQASLTAIESRLDAIIPLLQSIAGAVSRSNGGVLQ